MIDKTLNLDKIYKLSIILNLKIGFYVSMRLKIFIKKNFIIK